MSEIEFSAGGWKCPKCGHFNRVRGNYLSKAGSQQVTKRCNHWKCTNKVLMNVTISRETYEHTYTKVIIDDVLS